MTSGHGPCGINGVDVVEDLRPAGWHRLLVEPRRPASIRNRENAYWLAVGAVCVGAFMGQLDASIVTVAAHRSYPTGPNGRTFWATPGVRRWRTLHQELADASASCRPRKEQSAEPGARDCCLPGSGPFWLSARCTDSPPASLLNARLASAGSPPHTDVAPHPEISGREPEQA